MRAAAAAGGSERTGVAPRSESTRTMVAMDSLTGLRKPLDHLAVAEARST